MTNPAIEAARRHLETAQAFAQAGDEVGKNLGIIKALNTVRRSRRSAKAVGLIQREAGEIR